MPTWAWIVIAAGAVLLLALAVLAWTRGRNRRQLKQDRAEASELRRTAEERYAEAGRREAAAEQEALRARREREAADAAVRKAEDIDPDVDTDDVDTDDVDRDVASSEVPRDS
jgi:FtsZ-interacting cell division protein ZipA